MEELDKIDDKEGHQLDSVIRYFKNLFTQAPALFFFLTDKAYYDLISKKIELARRQRSYAIEHTFFTHRLFISRPRIEESLQYLTASFSQPDDCSQIEVIVKSQGDRVRGLEDMSLLEQTIRALLFRSQGHFFDLKNQMRQFVRVDGTGSWLESDEGMMPKSERAVAAFQFLVEQKMRSYRFGGGNDYANEELRNYLFAVFEALGSSEPQQIAHFHPCLDPQADALTLNECRRVVEAVGSLIEELERGGAIKRFPSDPSTTENGQANDTFIWKDHAALRFEPVARVEPHEEALFADLSRIASWAESFSQGVLKREFSDTATEAKDLSEQISQEVQKMMRSPVAIPIEEAINRRRETEKAITPLLGQAFAAHQQRLIDVYGLELLPISKTPPISTFILSEKDSQATRPVLLVYESFGQFEGEGLSSFQQPNELERLAVVNVVLDESPEYSRQLLKEALAASLTAGEFDQRSLLVSLPIHEDLEIEAFAAQWGEGTADELRLAQLWCRREMRQKVDGRSIGEPAGPYVLHTSGQSPKEMSSFNEVVSAWLGTDDDVLAWTSRTGLSEGTIEEELASSRIARPRVLVPYDRPFPGWKVSEQEKASLDRLIATCRVVFWGDAEWRDPYELRNILGDMHSSHPRILLQTSETGWLPRELGVSIIHPWNSDIDPMTVAILVQGRYPDYAAVILQTPAEAGNTAAMARLTMLLAGHDPEEARKWRTHLAQSGDTSAISEAAQGLEGDHPDEAAELYRPLAEAGNTDAMARLTMLLAGRDPEEARKWRTHLAQSGDTSAISEAAQGLEGDHPDEAAELYRPLAEAGNTDAMARLTMLLAGRDPEEARKWRTQLAQSGKASAISEAAQGLEGDHPDEAAELYRPLAEAGNTDAMARLTMLLAGHDPEEARKWRTQLAQSGDTSAIFEAAWRLTKGYPDEAAELYRALAEAGNTDAMARLTMLLAGRDPEEARKWRTQLAQSGKASAISEAAQGLEGDHPDEAAELYRPLAEAGNTDAMARLTTLLAGRDPEDARKWRTQLEKDHGS